MAFGFQLFKVGGGLLIDTSSRPARMVGAVPFSAGSGSFPFTPSPGKTPFAWILSSGQGAPYVVWANNQFTWGSSGASGGYILFGER